MKTKKRKEVQLDETTLIILEKKAEQQGRNLKNYMEFVLTENAHAFEPSEAYKQMMDIMIENHNKGITQYTDWEDVKKAMLKNEI